MAERTLHIVQKIEGRFAGETHITRTEAVEKMAREICNRRVGECPEKEYHCNNCWADSNTLLAEAALNALLSKED